MRQEMAKLLAKRNGRPTRLLTDPAYKALLIEHYQALTYEQLADKVFEETQKRTPTRTVRRHVQQLIKESAA